MKNRENDSSSGGAIARPINRRDFLAALAVAIGAGPVTNGFAQRPPVVNASSPNNRAFDFSSLKDWITPNSEFFVRSHFGVPKINPTAWGVGVGGAVERPRAFTLEELLRLPYDEQVVTLECAGNLVGWGGVSNARWSGVPLAALLKAAGVASGATEVILIGADGGIEREAGGIKLDAYARSIPISKALDPTIMLAFRMNGGPLPELHGGPVRVIVPGWYGMDSVKWLKQIVVAREPFNGFYQARRYYEARRVNGEVARSRLGVMRLKSQIARPDNEQVLRAGPVLVAGAAWCGDAEIARVEVSTDGGRTWRDARLGSDRAPFAWRLWSYDWDASVAGPYSVIARAFDARGRAQPLVRDPAIITPYANNWADRRVVEVRQ